jgi:hypothetical protein
MGELGCEIALAAAQVKIAALESALAAARRDRQVLLDAASSAIPEGEHPKDPTADNWAWQIHALGEDRRAAYKQRDEARAELAKKGGGR